MTHRGLRKAATLGLLAMLAALGACTHISHDLVNLVDQSGRDFEKEPDRVYRDVDFAALLANPSSYKLMDVRFEAIFNRSDENVFVSMYSTFRSEDYAAFSLWPKGGRLWKIEDRKQSVPTFYMNKGNSSIGKLHSIERYSTVTICGRVMGDFENLPFMEVRYLRVTGGPAYADEALSGMIGGLNDVAERRPSQAIEKLKRAVEGTLPEEAKAMCCLQLAVVFEERGEFDAALNYYHGALQNDRDNVIAKEGAGRVQTALDRKRALEEEKEPPQ